MSRWADWLAVTPTQVERLFAASCEGENPDGAVGALLEPMLRSRVRRPRVRKDKAWEPIHKCLTGDLGGYYEVDFDAGRPPLNLVVAGGEALLVGGHG